MRKLIFLVGLVLLAIQLQAQSDRLSYKTLWRSIYGYELKGLTRSASVLADSIYQKSVREGNDLERIRAIIYSSKFSRKIEEEAQLKIVERFKAEIDSSAFPTRNLLENILANMYWEYLQRNRWKLYRRSTTADNVDQSDFRTWDLVKLFEEITTLFERSIEAPEKLYGLPIKDFYPLMDKAEGSETLRPSLYDFLAHNALGFFETNESLLPQPADKYELKGPAYFGSMTEFLEIQPETADSSNVLLNALHTYQHLLRLHATDSLPDALIELELGRLDFARNYVRSPLKEQWYFEGLKQLKETYQSSEASAQIDYKIADFWETQGRLYIPGGDEAHRYKVAKALALCDSVINAVNDGISD